LTEYLHVYNKKALHVVKTMYDQKASWPVSLCWRKASWDIHALRIGYTHFQILYSQPKAKLNYEKSYTTAVTWKINKSKLILTCKFASSDCIQWSQL